MRQIFKKLGTYWGKFKITAGLISLYITGFNLILLTITAYPVIIEWLHQRNIVIPFWQYEGIIIFGIILILYVEYKFSLPGYYRASNDQQWKNDNPVRVELEAIREENAELKKQNELILKILGELSK